MKDLSEIYTLSEIERLVEEICRYDDNLGAELLKTFPMEDSPRPKVVALRMAVDRGVELFYEIETGIREPDGLLNVRV